MTSSDVFEFPSTPTQQALWFMHRLDPGSSAYNIPLAFRLRGAVDEASLRRSFELLAERHEILRTLFAERPGGLMQIVRSHLPPDWRSEQVEPTGDRESFLRRRAAAHASEPFDLTTGPLLRVYYDRIGPDEALLVAVFHHIVIDHLSLGQCASELTEIHRSVRRGEPLSLAEPEFQFADYAVWLQEHANAEELHRKVDVWRRRLAGFSGVLDLPLDAPRPPIQTPRGAEVRFSFDSAAASEARRFARGEGVSLFVVMLGALKVLMHHYSGQSDVIIGTPFANRSDREELERVVGCFINTLPIATDFSAVADFRELLQSVKDAVLEAFEHQDVPFEAIVDAVRPRRDPSHNPLFQVGFVLQAPPVALTFEGIEALDLNAHSGGAMYDLHFWAWERGDALEGLIWYNTDLFREETARRMAGHFEHVLAQLIATPERPLSSVVVPTAPELRQIDRWNETAVAWEPVESVVELVRGQCVRTPDAWAVIGARQRYTYAQIEERSNRLASHLIARGVRPGDLVAVALERDADLVVGLLGILKSGAAYVPLDPDYPRERIRFMLEETEAAVLLTQEPLLQSLPDHSSERVLLDTGWQEIERSAAELPRLDPDLRMYVIYTSGSTGVPKGVQVTHGNVINFLLSMARKPGIGSEDRLLAVTTLSFDIAVAELYLPLTCGATVVVAPREAAADGLGLRRWIDDGEITVMQGTPSTWRLLTSAGWRGSPPVRCWCGGEALPPDLALLLLDSGVEVWNVYGPTETTVWSTYHRLRDAETPIPIGTPFANTTCHVLNAARNPVPVRVPGELYIGGAGVTAGYLKRPQHTAEQYVRTESGEVLYRTGDIVRRRASGELEYLHRVDNQVKVRGFRIELGEIETVLAGHPAIVEAVVLAREYTAADKRLVAYVRYAGTEEATASELRRYLRDALPDYMIPQFFVELREMPRLPNGKIDRKALPDPLLQPRPEGEIVQARTAAEQRMVDIWRKALSIDQIGIDANFFELGGHSVLAMQVVYLVEQEFGVRINPRELVLNTLEQLAARLPQESAAEEPAPPAGGKGTSLLDRVKGRFGF